MTTRNLTELNQPREGEPQLPSPAPTSCSACCATSLAFRFGVKRSRTISSADVTAVGEYDVKLDEYEPSADTESATLREAVEQARNAIAKLPS